jgi:hypothetical protein
MGFPWWQPAHLNGLIPFASSPAGINQNPNLSSFCHETSHGPMQSCAGLLTTLEDQLRCDALPEISCSERVFCKNTKPKTKERKAMKSTVISCFLVLMLLTAVAFSKSDEDTSKTEAQKSFEKIKLLAGSWQSDDPKLPLTIEYRVTSNGSAVLSEMFDEHDHMITMIHLNDGRLMATHYCAAGNQPRMEAKTSADGKTVEFNFIDGTNLNSSLEGHMHRLVITLADAGHHTEDLIFQTKDGKHEKIVHVSMHRTN